eukprot:358894-Chlamydomonas_euryale.AAC.5
MATRSHAVHHIWCNVICSGLYTSSLPHHPHRSHFERPTLFGVAVHTCKCLLCQHAKAKQERCCTEGATPHRVSANTAEL